MTKSKFVTLKISSESLQEFPAEHITPKKRRKSSASSGGSTSKTQQQPIATPTPIKKESTLSSPIPNSRATTPSSLEDGRRRARGGRGGSKANKRSLLSSPAPEGPKQEPSTTTTTTIPSTPSVATAATNTNPTVKSTLSKTVTSASAGGGSGSNSGSNTSNGDNKLDKVGQTVRKWMKKPVEITTFTGYNIEFKSWNGGTKEDEEGVVNKDEELGTSTGDADKDKDSKTSFKVQIKLNNKKLNVDEAIAGDESRDQSPALPDDASSIVTTPEGSNAMTPA